MQAISKKIGCTLGAVTYVLRVLQIPRRSKKEAARVSFAAKRPSFRVIQARTAEMREIEAIGAMLYWAEGYKSQKAQGVDFANSDPAMVFMFMKFLRSRYELDEKRFRCFLYCHADQDKNALERFWGRLLEIPPAQFTKAHVRQDANGSGRIMRYGLAHIRYSDKKLLLDIVDLIESYRSRHCAGGRVVNYTAL